MKPTEVLKHEHQIILSVIGAAEREAQRIRSGGTVDTDVIAKFVDFFRNFADKCHHAKEERLLFPKLQERGVPSEGGPIGVMLHEHTEGRNHVAAMADAAAASDRGDAKAAAALAGHLLAFANLLRGHIHKEDNILFAIADERLSPADQEALSRAFDEVEKNEIWEGVHEQYHQLAHELMER
jgi:hemerythrin-like domain-containing protein